MVICYHHAARHDGTSSLPPRNTTPLCTKVPCTAPIMPIAASCPWTACNPLCTPQTQSFPRSMPSLERGVSSADAEKRESKSLGPSHTLTTPECVIASHSPWQTGRRRDNLTDKKKLAASSGAASFALFC